MHFTVQKVKVHCFPEINVKGQCVSQMCHNMITTVKNKSNNDARVNKFIYVNPYQPLNDIDFSIVNSSQPVIVNTVVHESDGEIGYEVSVLLKNGRNPTKGKNNQVTWKKT